MWHGGWRSIKRRSKAGVNDFALGLAWKADAGSESAAPGHSSGAH